MWDPTDDIWNQLMRFVFGIFRAVLGVLSDLGVSGLPSWFQWASRDMAGARSVLAAARMRAEADRRAAILADPDIPHWDRVRDMSTIHSRDIFGDVIETVCDVTDGLSSFIVEVLDIYTTFVVEFLEFVGRFWNGNGFNADYVNILVRYLLYVIVHNIPYLSCIVNVDALDILDPTTYFFDPYSILACLCPAYSSRSEVPSNIPLALVGCFCTLGGETNIAAVITKCIPGIATALEGLQTAYNEVRNAIDVTLEGLKTGYNTVIDQAKGIISDAAEVIDRASSFLTSLGRDGAGMRCAFNVTVVNATHCPVCPLLALPPLAPLPAPSVRYELPDHAAAFERKMGARRADIAAKRDALGARIAADFAPLVNGSMFEGFAASVARRHGPEVGARAAVMHAGFAAFFRSLYAAWGAPTIHHVEAAVRTPEFAAGVAAAFDVIDAHRRARGDAAPFGARGRDQMRVAARAPLPPAAMAPLIVELRAAGRHDAAAEAERWAGALHPRAWTSALARRGAAADAEFRVEARRAADALERAAADATRANSVVVHVGGMGGAFILGIFSQLLSVPAGPLLSIGASVVAEIGALLVTAFPFVLTIVSQVATAFFKNLAGGAPSLQNDVLTPLVNVWYPLIANGPTAGYTDAALDAVIASTVALAQRELLWIASEVTRVPLGLVAHTEGMDLDGDGIPNGDYPGWFTDKILNAPVDDPCLSSDDCRGYPCRLKSDTHEECKHLDPLSQGICYGPGLFCQLTDDCVSGTQCMSPSTFFATECTPSDVACQLNQGVCSYPCFINASCSTLGPGVNCYNRFSHAFDCTDEDPCALCQCIAWPLRAHRTLPDATLRSPGVPNCAAHGIELDDLDIYNLPSIREHGWTRRGVVSWDMVRFHGRCFRTTWQAVRVGAGWVVNGWNIRRTAIFAGAVSNFLIVLPTSIFSSVSHFALTGDMLSGAVGGAAGLQSAGEFLQGWPWPLHYALDPLGTYLVDVATYAPTGDEIQCIVGASGAILYTAADLIVLTVLLIVIVAAGVVSGAFNLAFRLVWETLRVVWVVGRVGHMGTRLARHRALPAPGEVVYGAAPDGAGKVHRRHHLHRAHPLRHHNVRDLAVIPGVHVRRATKAAAPLPWPEAVGEGVDMALRSVWPVVRRRGRVAADEWPDLFHDQHGPMRQRWTLIERK